MAPLVVDVKRKNTAKMLPPSREISQILPADTFRGVVKTLFLVILQIL